MISALPLTTGQSEFALHFDISRFFKALGYVSSVISVASFLVNQAVSTGASIWLAKWSDHTGSVIENGTDTGSNSSLSDELGR